MRFMVLPCDGIGPEIAAETVKVLQAADRRFQLGFEFLKRNPDLQAWKYHGTTLGEEVLDRARSPECDGVILGPHRTWTTRPSVRAAGTSRPRSASGSTSTRNVRPARSRDSSTRRRRAWTSSSCGKRPRASTPTGTCTRVSGSSCQPRTSHCRSERSPPTVPSGCPRSVPRWRADAPGR